VCAEALNNSSEMETKPHKGISSTKQAINARIKKSTKEWWQKSPRFKKTRLIDPSFPSAKYLEITSSLNRRQASILTQLRTGHAPINMHLHRIQKSVTPYCPQFTCVQATEDIRHLMFTCPRYIQERYQEELLNNQAIRRQGHHPPHAQLPQQHWTIQAYLRRYCVGLKEKFETLALRALLSSICSQHINNDSTPSTNALADRV